MICKLNSGSGRSGYVLIVTLLIIAMVGILTAGLARHSMNLALSTVKAEQELQLKWGAASCQRFALGNQRELLRQNRDEDESTGAQTRMRRSECGFQLGDQRFIVQLDNESAKLNVNHAHDKSKSKTTEVIRRLSDRAGLKIDLSPLSESRSRGPTEDSFECWGQVFGAGSDSARVSPIAIRDATEHLTCWSSQLDYTTAHPKAIYESTKMLVGGSVARKLTDLIEDDPMLDLSTAIDEAGATGGQKNELTRYLTNRSKCQSVWIEANTQHRQVHSLTVQEFVTDSLKRTYSFKW